MDSPRNQLAAISAASGVVAGGLYVIGSLTNLVQPPCPHPGIASRIFSAVSYVFPMEPVANGLRYVYPKYDSHFESWGCEKRNQFVRDCGATILFFGLLTTAFAVLFIKNVLDNKKPKTQ